MACPMCRNLYRFGKRILDGDVFCISTQGTEDDLPLPGLCRMLFLSAEPLARAERLPYPVERLYIKNKVYTGEQLATHLWLGDYTVQADGEVLELAQLAGRSGGAEEAQRRRAAFGVSAFCVRMWIIWARRFSRDSRRRMRR